MWIFKGLRFHLIQFLVLICLCHEPLMSRFSVHDAVYDFLPLKQTVCLPFGFGLDVWLSSREVAMGLCG